MENKKINFVAIAVVNGANPNGDPSAANSPRVDISGKGEISDVCIKHKIRMVLDAMYAENHKEGNAVLLVGGNYGDKREYTIKERIGEFMSLVDGETKKLRSGADICHELCKNFIDVRCFGTLLAGKVDKDSLSVPVTGAVTIQTAKSVQPIYIAETQITKTMSMEGKEKKSSGADGSKGSDTMGTKYRVDEAAYVIYGTIDPYMAEKNGVTQEDIEAIKYAIKHMFDLDASAARPAGTMELKELFWMTHPSKLGSKSSAAAHRAVKIEAQADYPFYKATLNTDTLGDIECEVWNDED